MGVCNSVVVGQPYSTCFDIAKAAGVTVGNLTTWNIGLNCNTLQLGQRICITAGPITAPNSDGSCQAYKVVAGDSCYAIGLNFGTDAATLESWNKNTYHWKGCSKLDVGLNMCVSSGTPPPVPVNPNVQCGPESSGNATCPLKACCSAFGFCGTTSEFCTAAANGDPCNSNCFVATLPSCPSGTLGRKVGYYAGWGARRPCQAVSAKQVSLDGLTHVLYAFATISDDMKIIIENDDIQPLKDLVARKGSAKVMIALGGWDFSQGDPTKALFTTMIGTSANRATFIDSTKTFLTQYGLDGIDVDMEYPASIERGGPPSDTPNLTSFFKELRAALPSGTISLASPAGYWFMKGYELDKIAPSVSFINLMAYDYHGPWDLNIPGEDPTANPHTSLNDTKEAVLLYRRIGIDMGQVNLGTAYYGRTFRLADPNCGTYGCVFTSAGDGGSCTNSAGTLSYSEISRLDGFKNAKHDQASETKYFMHGSDLVTFDDQDTLSAKAKFAAQTCFGGTMVWSIDQVDPPVPSTTPAPPTTTAPTKPPIATPTGKPCADAAGWAKDRVQKLWKRYIPLEAVPRGTPNALACGCFSDGLVKGELWHDIVDFEAVMNWMIQSGTTDYESQILSSGLTNANLPLGTVAVGDSHDDALWIVLLYMIIGDFQENVMKDPKDVYWNSAMHLLDWVGADTGHYLPDTTAACDGGVWWKHDSGNLGSSAYKNTITNALFIHTSAKAYMKGRGDKYLDQAKAAWKFISRLRDPADGLYKDGARMPDCDGADNTKYSYNQGAMVSALGALYKATGDKSYIDEALITIDGVKAHMSQDGTLREDCDITTDFTNLCNTDQVNFKGLALRHFSYFFDYVGDPSIVGRYSDWLGDQAKNINANAHNADGEVLSVWCGPDFADRAQMTDYAHVQRSALDAILVAMKYGTC